MEEYLRGRTGSGKVDTEARARGAGEGAGGGGWGVGGACCVTPELREEGDGIRPRGAYDEIWDIAVQRRKVPGSLFITPCITYLVWDSALTVPTRLHAAAAFTRYQLKYLVCTVFVAGLTRAPVRGRAYQLVLRAVVEFYRIPGKGFAWTTEQWTLQAWPPPPQCISGHSPPGLLWSRSFSPTTAAQR